MYSPSRESAPSRSPQLRTPGSGTATISSSTVFTRAVREGEVSAVSRPLHVGRTTITVQTDLADRAGRRVAQVTQVQAVLGGQHGR